MQIAEREATHQTTIKREVAQHLAFAASVADMLGETSQYAFWQVHLIIRALGPKRIHALLKDVLAIEAAGGLMTKNGKRRRTIGGVFFFLAKQQYRNLLPATFSRPGRPTKSQPSSHAPTVVTRGV